MKSTEQDSLLRVERTGFPMSILTDGSMLILVAMLFLVSNGNDSSNKAKGIRSSVRYHVCLFIKVAVEQDISLLTFVNFRIRLYSFISLAAAEKRHPEVNHDLRYTNTANKAIWYIFFFVLQ